MWRSVFYIALSGAFLVTPAVVAGCDETGASGVGVEESEQPREYSQGEPGEHDHGGVERHGSSDQTVELGADADVRDDLEVRPVELGDLRSRMRITAVVRHDINRVVHVTPLVEGQIDEIYATLGDDVERGEVLAVMRSVGLGEARSDVRQTESALEVKRQNYERLEDLADGGLVSERYFLEARGEFEQARARHRSAQARLDTLGVSRGTGPNYPLASQIDGTILEQHASVGETKTARDEVYVIADQSVVWVIGRVPESSAAAVRPGMVARVTLGAYPERSWEGTVDWIAQTIDEETRMLPIRVELDNPENLLKPGMFATIHLSADRSGRRIPVVPVGAVQTLRGHDIVFIPGEDDRAFRAVPVETGTEDGGRVEIVEGLSEDSSVVVEGAFELKAVLTAGIRDSSHQH